MTGTMTSDQRTAEAVADKLLGGGQYRCLGTYVECSFSTDDIRELAWIDDIIDRVAPGEIMPAGQCPDCGALIPATELDVVAASGVHYFTTLLRHQGYTVTEPNHA